MSHKAQRPETAHGDEGKAARTARNTENFRRATGRDPEHPVAGSQAWAEKNNLPDDTKDMPKS